MESKREAHLALRFLFPNLSKEFDPSFQASSRLQQFLFSMLQQKACPVSARVAQMALVDAYRKQYWRDAKTANALAEGVFHRVRRIQASINIMGKYLIFD